MKKKAIKKGFIGNHAKSSAMVVSLAIHAVFIVVAVSFVAVKMIVKDERKFEAKQVVRPKMKIKKLQIPVIVKTKRPKPKFRKRLVVNPALDRKVPEIKMPDITGVKGGLGNVMGDTGFGAGGIGFTMPEINIFGVKSTGEKVFIILDSDAEMMYDEMGGIAAYDLIKKELLRMIGELPSTVLFNVAVFQRGDKCQVLFPTLVRVSPGNVESMKRWIEPLNRVSTGMGDKSYGVKTLGAGGVGIDDQFNIEPIESYGYWVNPILLAMKQQADSIYLITSRWGNLRHRVDSGKKGNGASRQKTNELYEKAKQKLAEENKQRRKNGDPPRVLEGKVATIKAYFPDAHFGGDHVYFDYTPKIMNDSMDAARAKYKSKLLLDRSGIFKKDKYSFNVVHFVQQGGDFDDKSIEKLKQMASLSKGEYRSLAGLEAIQSCLAQE